MPYFKDKCPQYAALQCGICTPGFLIAAKALLDKNPDPTETEIRYALAGNLCRCTGYDKIVRAVQATAKTMKSKTDKPKAGSAKTAARKAAKKTAKKGAK